MYETDSSILCSAPFDQRFGRYSPQFLPELEVKKRIAYVFYKNLGFPANLFEKSMKQIGGRYKKRRIGPFTVFYNFVPPSQDFKKVSVTAADFSANFNPDDALLAVDGDFSTRWGSRSPQKPGMFFLLNLKRTIFLNKIVFQMGRYCSDRPRKIVIEVSSDGKIWQEVFRSNDVPGGLFWNNLHPTWCIAKKHFSAVFSPVKTQYIKIIQTGKDSRFDWSIAELEIYRKNG